MEEDTAQSIGIVGGGEIGRAIVEGLCNGGSVSPDAFLFPGEPAPPPDCPSASRTSMCAPRTRRCWAAPSW